MSNFEGNQPIGVFDSGLGGLTVVKELMRQLPNEDIVYYGDTARVPYGSKSKESIVRFSQENTDVLLKYKVKMVVIACNSCSSYALPTLHEKYKVPIIGVINPGAKKAVAQTRNQRVGVIATSATINSQAYTQAIKSYNNHVQVFDKACPLFVPLVEEGWFEKKVTYEVAKEYLQDLKKCKIDALILGCTHYPLLKSTLQKVMGKSVSLVDSACEVATEVKDLLKKAGIDRRLKSRGKYKFLISDKPQQFKKIATTFLGYDISQRIEYV